MRFRFSSITASAIDSGDLPVAAAMWLILARDGAVNVNVMGIFIVIACMLCLTRSDEVLH
jgi:hypothetical protein